MIIIMIVVSYFCEYEKVVLTKEFNYLTATSEVDFEGEITYRVRSM